jgi:hypothetical protein
LVLALHAMACVAGFIAGSSLPLQAARHKGTVRLVHERGRPVAMAFVTVAIAIPILILTAFWEVYGAPHLLAAVLGHLGRQAGLA